MIHPEWSSGYIDNSYCITVATQHYYTTSGTTLKRKEVEKCLRSFLSKIKISNMLNIVQDGFILIEFICLNSLMVTLPVVICRLENSTPY